MLKLKDNSNPQEPYRRYVSPDILLKNVASIDGLPQTITDNILDTLMQAGYVTIGEVLNDGYYIAGEKLRQIGKDRFWDNEADRAFHNLFYKLTTDRANYREEHSCQPQTTLPDWEQRRYDLAKSILSAWAPHCGASLVNHVEDALAVADKVVKQMEARHQHLIQQY